MDLEVYDILPRHEDQHLPATVVKLSHGGLLLDI